MAAVSLIGVAKADPVDLSAIVDANGFIDLQPLTCAPPLEEKWRRPIP